MINDIVGTDSIIDRVKKGGGVSIEYKLYI